MESKETLDFYYGFRTSCSGRSCRSFHHSFLGKFSARKGTHQILEELLPKLLGRNWAKMLKCVCCTNGTSPALELLACCPLPWKSPLAYESSFTQGPMSSVVSLHPVWWMMWDYKGLMSSPNLDPLQFMSSLQGGPRPSCDFIAAQLLYAILISSLPHEDRIRSALLHTNLHFRAWFLENLSVRVSPPKDDPKNSPILFSFISIVFPPLCLTLQHTYHW